MKLALSPLLSRTLPTTAIALGLAALSACLTLNVNVNFPESAVQQATDSYVHELYKQKEKGRPARKLPDPGAKSAPEAPGDSKQESFFDLIPAAYAAEISAFSISSAKALKIQEKLATWVDEVLAQKKAGVIGETKDATLVIKDSSKVKPLLLKKLEQMVAEENQLREELYQEVIKSNSMSKDRLGSVKDHFKNSFQSESPGGTWIQDQTGAWTQKAK